MENDNKEPIILQKEMIQRLIKDVKQIKKNRNLSLFFSRI